MASDRNILQLMKRREIDDSISRRIQSRLHVTDELLFRLGLEKELEGHTGCVNCLEWNESGRILASASDDFRVIVWDPFRYKKIHVLTTNHHGNIFSVKFMPKTDDHVILTGAGDFMINVHDLSLSETTRVCSCHSNRVKRLATVPDCPYMFWSASEDGTIRQFDLRKPHTCSSDVSNVLVYLRRGIGKLAEAKCIATNPLRPELLAVGANDPFVRVYDRRMIRTISVPRQTEIASGSGEPDLSKYDNLPDGCVSYFVAGHLPSSIPRYHRKLRNLAATYVTFGPNGRDLLVNLGSEQIYLFDIYSKRKAQSFDFKLSPYYHDGESSCECSTSKQGTNGYSNGITSENAWLFSPTSSEPADSSSSRPELPSHVERLRLSANYAFEKEEYLKAVRLYNQAISLYPDSSVLYGNRAAALMKRDWDGDMYAALRDCQTTLQMEPTHFKAHFRMIRCLHELNWTDQAADCVKVFKNKFPVHAYSCAYRALEKDIHDSIASKAKAAEAEAEENKKRGRAWEISFPAFVPYRTEQERKWQEKAVDYERRFCGHCNTTTDIKEATFFGDEGQYIVAGSDDGAMYFWERSTGNNIRILKADGSIVNCLQPHPMYCLLASSGIDPVVRLWSPSPQDGRKEDREVDDKDFAAAANQKRMKADPFDVVLMNMGYQPAQLSDPLAAFDDDEDENAVRLPPTCACRPS